MESFPQTANGKLDRNALPNPPIVTDRNATCDHSNVPKSGSVSDTCSNTMVDLVCGVVEKLRGNRPPESSSFASFGIDSLGSILFLKALSDALGGVRIDVKMVYGPGITVKSFAQTLYNKLKEERPEVLSAKNITAPFETVTEDLEDADANKDDPSSESFDDRVLVNRDLLEGIRGVLTLLVWWDHGHSQYLTMNYTFQSDTELFILMSGFATALQFRSTREIRSPKDLKSFWDIKSFLISRAVGVFPVMWLALLLNAPRWHLRALHDVMERQYNMNKFDKLPYPVSIWSNDPSVSSNEGFCAPFYVFAMQSWLKNICTDVGPYDVYYAAVIWTCFLAYAVIRLLLDRFQKLIRLKHLEYRSRGADVTRDSVLQNTVRRLMELCIELSENRLGWARFVLFVVIVYTALGYAIDVFKVLFHVFYLYLTL